MSETKGLKLGVITPERIQSVIKNEREFNKFLSVNQKFINSIVHQAMKSFSVYDDDTFVDLNQIGNIALWRCLHHFDPSKQFKLSTLAYTAIKRDILRYCKDNVLKIRQHSIPFNDIMRISDDMDIEFNEMLFKENHHIHSLRNFEKHIVEKISIEEKKRLFSNNEQKIFHLRVVEKRPHKEIAKILGLNMSTYKAIFYNSFKKKFQDIMIDE